jgi:hypothetical protein
MARTQNHQTIRAETRGVFLRDGGYWYAVQQRGVRRWINLETRDLLVAVQQHANFGRSPC